MAYCSKCGTQLKDGAKFCHKCGKPVTTAQTNNDSIENRSSYSLELISSGPATLQMAKILMDLLGIEMREAKDIIKSTPSTLVTGLSLSRAEEIAQMLQSVGAKIEIKQSNKTNIVEKSSRNVVKQSHKPIINEQQLQFNDSLTEGSSKNVWGFVGVCVICFLVLSFLLVKCVGNGSSDRASYSSSSTRTEQEQKPVQIQKHEFFEPGHTYISNEIRVPFSSVMQYKKYEMTLYIDGSLDLKVTYRYPNHEAEDRTHVCKDCTKRGFYESKRDIVRRGFNIGGDYVLNGRTYGENFGVDYEGHIWNGGVSWETMGKPYDGYFTKK
jgi:large subunit ribosomal protein L7/L12